MGNNKTKQLAEYCNKYYEQELRMGYLIRVGESYQLSKLGAYQKNQAAYIYSYYDNCKVNEVNIKSLTKLKWPNLVTLSLARNSITQKMVGQLVKADFPSLIELQLQDNCIKNQGLKQICCQKLKNIKALNLSNNLITQIKCLCLQYFQNLTKLLLDNNLIGSEGAQVLLRIQFRNLQHLNLNKCYIMEKGFSHLAKASWNKINKICLMDNCFSLEGYTRISQNNWDNLNQLYVGGYQHIQIKNPIYIFILISCKSNWVKIRSSNLSVHITNIVKERAGCY